MSVSEFQRHEVFKWLETQMGAERATIMMELLPPVGWGDITTRRDLASLEARMDAQFSELRTELHATSADLLLKLFFGFVASNATLVGLVLAAVRFA